MTVSDMLHLPYIHRFDLLTVGDRHYFIGCTLATTKESKEDWSNPGKIWVGEFTGGRPAASDGAQGRPDQESRLQPADPQRRDVQPGDLRARCLRGHSAANVRALNGRSSSSWTGRSATFLPSTSTATANSNSPPSNPSTARISGCTKRSTASFRKIFEHPETSEFYHVVVGTTLAGTPVFIGGCRRGKQQLFYVQASKTSPLELKAELIEEGVGPSNVHVVHEAEPRHHRRRQPRKSRSRAVFRQLRTEAINVTLHTQSKSILTHDRLWHNIANMII